jgi:hypothetical protein
VLLLCFFALGNYSLLCYGVPIDLGERLAGTAAGVMTCSQYLASGTSAIVMGWLVHEHGFDAWWVAMLLMTTLQFLAIWLI